jgi:putative redox protein
MASVRLDFTSKRGQKLAGKLELPDGELRGYALLVPCFTCGKDFKGAKALARGLAEQGWAALRFDLTGIGESEGDFAETGFRSHAEDVGAAAEALRQRYAAPALLVGHSLGGAAALLAAPSLEEVRAVAVIGTPGDPAHVLHQLEGHVAEIERDGVAEVDLAGRRFRIGRTFLEEVRKIKLDAVVRGLGRALLVLHAPLDAVVGVENARAIYERARHPKSFVSLDDADHLLTKPADAAYAAGVIAAWARRYVGEPPTRALDTTTVEQGTVLVEETGAGKFHQAVRVGRHRLVADEPLTMGGEDAGPSPYDFLLAGLGACTSMTIRLYADRKGWPLEQVRVSLRHEKIHAQDCADCEQKDGRIDEIRREIALEGPLDAEQRRRLLEIAERCPVHKTLESEVKVRTRLAETA